MTLKLAVSSSRPSVPYGSNLFLVNFNGIHKIWRNIISIYTYLLFTAAIAVLEIYFQSYNNVNKKLSYRRGTARRSTLVSSCYVLRGMTVRKVSISKSDLQGHSRALALVPFDKPHSISYTSSIATVVLFGTANEILSFISRNLKRSRDSERIPFGDTILCMYYSCASITTRNLKCLALPVPKI